MILSGLYVLQLGRIIDCFSSLASCKTFSNIMRTRPKGGGFQVSYRSIPPSPISTRFGIFSNSTLKFRRQPKAKAVIYIVLRVFWPSLTNNLKAGFPCLTFVFLVDIIMDLTECHSHKYYNLMWCVYVFISVFLCIL